MGQGAFREYLRWAKETKKGLFDEVIIFLYKRDGELVMAAPRIAFVDSGGTAYSLDTSVPINFGTVVRGAPSSAKQVYIKNYEADVDLIAVEVDCIEHPYGLQVGTAEDTCNSMTYSATAGGTYEVGPYYVGTVWANTATTNFYCKWTPPATAALGARIWAMRVSGNFE